MRRSKGSERVPGRIWAYGSVVTGAVVSIAANVAHSYVPPKSAPAWWPAGTPWDAKLWHPKMGAVVFAVLWPVALALGTEVLTRIPWPKRWCWIVLRFGGVLPVAAVAAIVSYKHLSALLAFYGEDALTAHIGPFAIDGLMVVATGALMATAGHGTASTKLDTTGQPDTEADTTPDTPDTAPDSVPGTVAATPVPMPETAPTAQPEPLVTDTAPDTPDRLADTADTVADTVATAPDSVPDTATEPVYAGQPGDTALVSVPDTADTGPDTLADTAETGSVSAPGPAVPLWPEHPAADAVTDTADTADMGSDTDEVDLSQWPDTATAVAQVRAAHPWWSSTQIGEYLGVSARTVRRHLAAADAASGRSGVNGTPTASKGTA